MTTQTPVIDPIIDWIQEHRIASIIILNVLLIVLSGIWWVRPAYFAVTHTNMQDCGYISRPFGGPVVPQSGSSGGAKQAIQCFVQAHQQCQAASLASTSHGVDTGTTETFYTANGLGQCGLSLETTNYGIVRTITTDDNCSSMVQKPDGLHFLSCGDSPDLLVPLK
jgi:hypothetical protein